MPLNCPDFLKKVKEKKKLPLFAIAGKGTQWKFYVDAEAHTLLNKQEPTEDNHALFSGRCEWTDNKFKFAIEGDAAEGKKAIKAAYLAAKLTWNDTDNRVVSTGEDDQTPPTQQRPRGIVIGSNRGPRPQTTGQQGTTGQTTTPPQTTGQQGTTGQTDTPPQTTGQQSTTGQTDTPPPEQPGVTRKRQFDRPTGEDIQQVRQQMQDQEGLKKTLKTLLSKLSTAGNDVRRRTRDNEPEYEQEYKEIAKVIGDLIRGEPTPDLVEDLKKQVSVFVQKAKLAPSTEQKQNVRQRLGNKQFNGVSRYEWIERGSSEDILQLVKDKDTQSTDYDTLVAGVMATKGGDPKALTDLMLKGITQEVEATQGKRDTLPLRGNSFTAKVMTKYGEGLAQTAIQHSVGNSLETLKTIDPNTVEIDPVEIENLDPKVKSKVDLQKNITQAKQMAQQTFDHIISDENLQQFPEEIKQLCSHIYQEAIKQYPTDGNHGEENRRTCLGLIGGYVMLRLVVPALTNHYASLVFAVNQQLDPFRKKMKDGTKLTKEEAQLFKAKGQELLELQAQQKAAATQAKILQSISNGVESNDPKMQPFNDLVRENQAKWMQALAKLAGIQ